MCLFESAYLGEIIYFSFSSSGESFHKIKWLFLRIQVFLNMYCTVYVSGIQFLMSIFNLIIYQGFAQHIAYWWNSEFGWLATSWETVMPPKSMNLNVGFCIKCRLITAQLFRNLSFNQLTSIGANLPNLINLQIFWVSYNYHMLLKFREFRALYELGSLNTYKIKLEPLSIFYLLNL